MARTEQTVKFIFNKPEEYKIVYVNGIIGSITPRGDICCHLFQEYPCLPAEQEFKVMADGKLGDRVGGEEEVPILNRDLKVGVIFKVEDAEAIANFILDKVKSLKGEKS